MIIFAFCRRCWIVLISFLPVFFPFCLPRSYVMKQLLACGIKTTAVFGAAAPNFRIPDNLDLLIDGRYCIQDKTYFCNFRTPFFLFSSFTQFIFPFSSFPFVYCICMCVYVDIFLQGLIFPVLADDFANSNLVFLSKKEKAITPTGKADDPPVLCETICRPTNPDDRKKAGVGGFICLFFLF